MLGMEKAKLSDEDFLFQKDLQQFSAVILKAKTGP
jgi:hypothetical protein